MKKILLLMLATLMLISLIACGETKTDGNDTFDTGISDDTSDDSGMNDETSDGDGEKDDTTDGEENTDSGNDTDSACEEHNYVGNICDSCGCSLWNGEIDTSWYSVIDLEFTINTAQEFAGLIDIVNNGTDLANVKITLASHIDMNGKAISPIGATPENKFSGEFCGGNYSVRNVKIDTDSIILSEDEVFDEKFYTAYVGLFGYSDGKVSDIDLKDLSIDISSDAINYLYVGGIVALGEGEIKNCSVGGEISVNTNNQFYVGGIAASTMGDVIGCSSDVSIVAKLSCEDFDVNPHIGGLVALSSGNTVSECCSTGSATFTMTHDEVEINELYIGGLIGLSSDVNIVNCYSSVYSEASVIRNNACYVGGLVGRMEKGTVKACYSLGDVTLDCLEDGYAGSLIGYVRTDYFSSVLSTISVSDCFAVGNVSCVTDNEECVCSTIGQNADEVVTNCYYASDMILSADDIVKDGTPAGRNDLVNTAFYSSRMLWDTDVWNITDGEYPTLK